MGPAEDSSAGKTLADEARAAAGEEEFWRVSALHLHRALLDIGGGRAKGGGILSARAAARIARKALDDFQDAVRDEAFARQAVKEFEENAGS